MAALTLSLKKSKQTKKMTDSFSVTVCSAMKMCRSNIKCTQINLQFF